MPEYIQKSKTTCKRVRINGSFHDYSWHTISPFAVVIDGSTGDFTGNIPSWHNTATPLKIDNTDSLFLKLDQSWNSQYESMKEYFTTDKFSLTEKVKWFIELLLQFNPDKMTLEVTRDKSIFYTIIKDNVTIYAEHYVELNDNDELDELIVSIYIDSAQTFNYGGKFWEAFAKLEAELSKHSIVIIASPEFA